MKKRLGTDPFTVDILQLYRGRLEFAGNKRHLEILDESLRRRSPRFWNRWREQNPRVVPDLKRVNLSGRALRGLNLSRTKLDEALLRRVDLIGAESGTGIVSESRFLVRKFVFGSCRQGQF